MKNSNNQSQAGFKSRMVKKWKSFYKNYPILAKITGIGALIGVAGFVFLIGLILSVRFGAFGQLPSAAQLKDIQNHTASEVYSSDGKVIGKYFIENRTIAELGEISPHITNALVATEDARFFNHKGIDVRAWFRVLIKTVILQDDSGGGGSTLSQQLAKNLYPRKRYRFFTIPIAKLKEMFLAKRLERAYTKEELLNIYLNTVPFGGNIFGVKVASKQFFNSTLEDIKIEEAAVLVGMLKANTYYHPVRNPERAKARRNVVLSQMAKYKHLPKSQLDSLQKLDLIVEYNREDNNEGLATYFREHLRQELGELVKNYEKEDGTPYNLYTDGLKIYTSVDSRMQSYAEAAVTEHLAKLQKDFDEHWKGQKPWGSDNVIQKEVEKSNRYKRLKDKGYTSAQIKKNFETPRNMTLFSWKGEIQEKKSPLDSIRYYFTRLNAGFLAMDPKTGDIKAWVGGIDHKYFKYDHVKSKRQVGSTFKPIVYANALRNGVQPCNYIDNNLVIYSDYEDWKPENSDGKYGGVYSMAGALRNSVNSVAVNLIMRSGVDSVRQLAKEMGVTSDIPNAPAIALGAVDLSLFEMVKVYGTLANRGVQTHPQYLIKIENSKGEVITEFKQTKKRERVLSQDNADIMTKMMQGVVDSGTARRLRFVYNFKNDIAGKTGTTQSHADGWFMGYTSDMVAGAWVGGESPRVRFRSIRLGQGANTALPIWARFMKKVHADKEFKKMKFSQFAEPSELVQEAMNCEAYLTEAPVFVDEEIEPEEEEGGDGFFEKFDDLLGSLKKKPKTEMDPRVNERPTKKKRKPDTKEQKKEKERIKKKNAKRKKKEQKKKKKKKQWDDLFKKKN